ncbi:MAG: hypothetical protein JRI98_05030 [Deltaproteobacteria bacterium]|nr:hypothetical protein [Deltaproteobacteria bacterium]
MFVHLPIYEVLGGLADRIRMEDEEAKQARKFDPVEVDFEISDDTKSQRARKKSRQRQQKAKRELLAKAVQEQAQQAVHCGAEQSGRRGNRRPNSQHDSRRPDSVPGPPGEAVGHA